MRIFSIVFVIVMGLTRVVNAQIQHDTSEVKVREWPVYLTANTLLQMDTSTLKVDTTLSGIERLHPVFDAMDPLFDLGQLGSPTMEFDRDLRTMGFTGPTTSHMGVWLYEGFSPVAATTSPLTRLAYSQGGGDLIYLTASHQRNVFERWNTQLDYRRVKNNNIYYSNVGAPENTKLNDLYNLRWSNRYQTLNHRYEVLAALRWNQVRRVETGGLENLNRFQLLEGRDKEANNPAFLNSATSQYRSLGLDVIQFYRPGRSNPDSAMRANPPHRAQLKQQFFHQFTVEQKRMRFQSNAVDTPLMNYPGFDQDLTLDSFTHLHWYNRLGYVFKEKNARSEVSVDADANTVKTIYGNRWNYLNTSVQASRAQLFNGLLVKAGGQYFLSGYNAGDALVHSEISKNLKGLRLSGYVHYSLTEPVFKAQHFVANNLYWDQDLEKEVKIPIRFRWKTMKNNKLTWSGGLEQVFLRNFTYFRLKENPVQSDDFSVQRLHTKLKVNLRHLDFQQSIALNRWTSDQNVMGLPPWYSQSRLAYKALLFQGNLVFEMGVNARIFGSFYANRFDPVSREFVVQSETQLPTYPIMDVFINGQVKTMRFFLNMTHVNEDLLEGAYYGSPYYPGINRALRIGIFWDLFY